MTDERVRSSGSPEGDSERQYSDDGLVSLASEIDSAGVDAKDPWDLLQRLSAAYNGPDGNAEPSVLRAMCERALAYSFIDEKQKYGAVSLGQRFSSAGGDWPPAFDAVDPQEKRCWAELADHVTHILPKAHFTDLALVTGEKPGRGVAETIVGLYVQLGASAALDLYYRASCLRRAWTLSRQFSLPSEPEIRRALFTMAQSGAKLTEVPPGLLLRPLEPLAVAPRMGPFVNPGKGEVTALLDVIESRCGRSETMLEGILGIREQLADNDGERESARRARVQGHLDLAAASDGFLRMTRLQQAAKEAQRFGLPDLRDVAVTAMQDTPVEDLGMESVTTESRIPRYMFDVRLSRYRRSRSALDALEIWLTTPAPTGPHEANVRQADADSRRGILRLVSRTTLDFDGMPVRSSVGPESAERERLEWLENVIASVYGNVLANELAAIKTEYGVVSAQEIGIHLATRYGCDCEKALALGEAIESYWAGRHADAARAAFPLVEAGARGLLLALGEPLFRIETGNSAGHFPSLETYADRLETIGLDIDWIRTVRNPVATLRNSMAHGHKLRPTKHDAAILLRTAGLFVILTPPDASKVDRLEVQDRLRDPLAFAGQRAGLRRQWRRVWAATRWRRS